MPQIVPIPALNNNYIWMIKHPEFRECIIIDPGDAKAVIDVLTAEHLALKAILITHHHQDHTQGVEALLERYHIPVYASSRSSEAYIDQPLQQDDYIHFPNLDIYLRVMEIPGHTLDHIAYVGMGGVFCGDTLFTGGCGRLFEGTAKQLWQSLSALADLPDSTLIYCGHEYTESNLRFAKHVDPENPVLLERIASTLKLRARGKPTVPSSLEMELKTNPFLRSKSLNIRNVVEKHCGRSLNDPLEVFTELRRWKDEFGSGLP